MPPSMFDHLLDMANLQNVATEFPQTCIMRGYHAYIMKVYVKGGRIWQVLHVELTIEQRLHEASTFLPKALKTSGLDSWAGARDKSNARNRNLDLRGLDSDRSSIQVVGLLAS
jgi:hypothetical protein